MEDVDFKIKLIFAKKRHFLVYLQLNIIQFLDYFSEENYAICIYYFCDIYSHLKHIFFNFWAVPRTL